MKILKTLLIICFFSSFLKADNRNILILEIDNEKLGDLDYAAQVPNLAGLRDKALRLDNFYSPTYTEICVELLSGKYPVNVKNVALGGDMQADEACIAKSLKEKGYNTAYIGKWRNSKSPSGFPSELGFDLFFGVLDSESKWWPYDWQTKALKEGKLKVENIKNPLLRMYFNENLLEITANNENFLPDFTSESLDFIDSAFIQAKPFFLYLNYGSSYAQTIAIEKFFPSEDKAGIKKYYADLDANFSKILRDLESKGILQNTMIIVISKRAMEFEDLAPMDPKNLAPEQKHKFSAFVYMPSLFPEPKNLDGIVGSIDIYGLLNDFAKASNGENSMLGYFLGNQPCDDSPILYYSPQREFLAIRDNNYKLLLAKSMRKIDAQLYDLDKDPKEQNNLAKSMPEKVAELKKKANLLDSKQEKVLTKWELEKRAKEEKAAQKLKESQEAKKLKKQKS